MGSWLALRVSQPGRNHDAIGAWIEVQLGETVLRRELTIGGGHAGGQLGWTHFGPGASSVAQVRIEGPDGEVGPWLPGHAHPFVDVRPGARPAPPWPPQTLWP